ncbi:hypothetical protein [Bacillus smithii]|uniref:Preprotein translocase subunit Tim44 n=1 Tax=Bacillus smithii 7_3_47FAA TaxID=665952 RepID=G9QHT1_9BACI|nr:hypothetical protein [Bacillus smithii]EHL79278.1 hypothetical protein HMPREF1015_01295 [Bacillus smithii 7_3_47FAA]
MFKKWVKWLSSLALVFSLVGLGMVDSAAAKGYRSGKGFYQPSHSQQVVPNKNQNSSIFNSSKSNTTPYTHTVPQKSSKGSFAKGLLLGGLGGFLAGSLFHGLGPISSMLGFVINLFLLYAVVMLVVSAIRLIFNRRHQREYDSWRR